MATKDSIQRKKDYAKLLYVTQGVTVQTELAERSGVSKQTINKWINKENWETLRASLILTKENELKRLYMQLTELNDKIMDREPGERFANNKEADILVKIGAAIKQLETDTSVADTIEVMKNFINHVRAEDYSTAKTITAWADNFIKSRIK